MKPVARGLGLFGALALAWGCRAGGYSEAARVITLPLAPKATAPLPAPLPAGHVGRTCEAIVRQIETEVAELAKSAELDLPKRTSMVGVCSDSPKGAWFVALPPDAKATPPASEEDLAFLLDSAWEVHFEPASGPGAKRVHKEELANFGARIVHPPRLFDFDGDGVPELYLAVDETGDEGHRARQHGLFSFRDGKVVPYAPVAAIPFTDLVDHDGDGRPDLLMYAGYTDSLEGCYSGFPTDHARPSFLAHSLADGTFSTDDAVAKAFVASWCAKKPGAIASSYDAVCARLFARDAAAVKRERARVAASCTGGYCEREEASKKQPANASMDCERRVAWFGKAPPFLLP